MAKQELRRKIIATVLTVTMLCALLGVCAWLLLSNKIFNSTIHTMMLLCTAVLGIATIGLLVAKVQEILALREVVRKESAEPAPAPAPVQHTELEPVQSLDHKTIELPKLTDVPLAGQTPAAQEQPKAKLGRRGRDSARQSEPDLQPVQPAVEVIPPTPVSVPETSAEPPKWKPIDFGAALKARENQAANAARRRAQEAQQAQLAEQQRLEQEAAPAPQTQAAPVQPAADLADTPVDAAVPEKTDAAEALSAGTAPAAPEAEKAAETEAVFDTVVTESAAPAVQEIPFDEPEPSVPQELQTPPCASDEDAFDYDSANAEHLQAIRHVQEARRSAETKQAEEAELAEVARQAEQARIAAQPQPEQAAPAAVPAEPVCVNSEAAEPAPAAEAAEPIDSGMWEAWQSNAVSFTQQESAPVSVPEPAAAAAPAEPMHAEESTWSQTLNGTVPPEEEPVPEAKAEPAQKAASGKKKHLGFFGVFNRRKKAAPARDAVKTNASAPAPAPVQESAPAVPAAAQEDEPAPVKLNVKPIAWPAPPPPSRNFVHPPQSTMQFSAITPEQISQIQAEAQRQKVERLNAQRQAATQQAARNAQKVQSSARPSGNSQSGNNVSNTESYWKN